MLARQQELNVQFHQLLDAFLLAFSLFAAHALRFYGTEWLELPYSIDPFRNYQWLLIVIVPFGPILLDLRGFYQSQISGRNQVQDFRDWVKLDLIDRWSLGLDQRILLRTIPAVLLGLGRNSAL